MKIKTIIDDLEIVMTREDGKILVLATNVDYDHCPTAGQTKTFVFTPEQAAATLALIVVCPFKDRSLSKKLYDMAAPAWKDAPEEIRPIP